MDGTFRHFLLQSAFQILLDGFPGSQTPHAAVSLDEADIGEWYEQNGCFWGNDLQENTYIITYDGVQYPYDGECKSLNRVDGQYVDCTSDGKIRKLNEETGEWEEWIDCPQWLNFGQR